MSLGEHHPVKRVEAMLVRGEWGQVPKVPLPNAGGGVAAFLQDLSQVNLVGVQPHHGNRIGLGPKVSVPCVSSVRVA